MLRAFFIYSQLLFALTFKCARAQPTKLVPLDAIHEHFGGRLHCGRWQGAAVIGNKWLLSWENSARDEYIFIILIDSSNCRYILARAQVYK